MIINMEFKKFNDIFNIIKNMKSNIIYIENNIIFGFDENFCVVRRVFLSESFPIKFITTTLELSDFMKNSSEMGTTEIFIDISSWTISSMYGNLTNQIFLYNQSIFNNIKNQLIMIDNMIPNYTIDDLKSREDFNNILDMKSADGIGIINIENKYLITLYNNLIPVNKADKVSLNIYDIDTTQFLTMFKIKKSKCIIELFMRCIKV